MSETQPNHLDYAEEAESAQRAEAWPQAAALWLLASETCSDVDQARQYVRQAEACNQRQATHAKLEEIARSVLRIPTLRQRGSDRLDFHDLSVGQIKSALRAAVEAGRAEHKAACARILLSVRGGVVQDVYCSDPELEVAFVDWDCEGVAADPDGGHFEIDGQVVAVSQGYGHAWQVLEGTDCGRALEAYEQHWDERA